MVLRSARNWIAVKRSNLNKKENRKYEKYENTPSTKDTNYATQQILFSGHRTLCDCRLHYRLGAFHVGFDAHTGYHHGRI
jgi:hypothetical protein